MKAFLRKHNHDFGDRDSYYNTTYDLSHNKPYNKYDWGRVGILASIKKGVPQLGT